MEHFVIIMLGNILGKVLQVVPAVASSSVGEMVVRAGLAMVQEKTGVPVSGRYDEQVSRWHVDVGALSADMGLTVDASNEALGELLKEFVPDALAGRPVHPQKLQEFLRRSLRRS